MATDRACCALFAQNYFLRKSAIIMISNYLCG